jgi:transposase
VLRVGIYMPRQSGTQAGQRHADWWAVALRTRTWLVERTAAGTARSRCSRARVVLHFLPPYCPNENRIERLWEDLHAEVTRNHGRATMEELMKDVRWFIRKRSVRRNQAIRKVAA